MYHLIYNYLYEVRYELFKTKEELLNFVNGLSFEEVVTATVIHGDGLQMIKTEKGWGINE